jgi:hypothetical protein
MRHEMAQQSREREGRHSRALLSHIFCVAQYLFSDLSGSTIVLDSAADASRR